MARQEAELAGLEPEETEEEALAREEAELARQEAELAGLEPEETEEEALAREEAELALLEGNHGSLKILMSFS